MLLYWQGKRILADMNKKSANYKFFSLSPESRFRTNSVFMDLIPNPLPDTLSAFSSHVFLPLATQIHSKEPVLLLFRT